MAEGNLLAANNLHVLDYRAARERTRGNRRERNKVNAQYRDLFAKLSDEGLAVGTYNRALFEFRCAARQECYETGKARFLKANRQGDPLAKSAYVLTLSYTELESDPDRRPLLKAAADAGTPIAAFTYSTIVWSKDKVEGKKYAQIAADAGYAHAQNHLALFHN